MTYDEHYVFTFLFNSHNNPMTRLYTYVCACVRRACMCVCIYRRINSIMHKIRMNIALVHESRVCVRRGSSEQTSFGTHDGFSRQTSRREHKAAAFDSFFVLACVNHLSIYDRF